MDAIHVAIRAHGERIARDETPDPVTFWARSARLVRRGLSPAIARDVYAAGSTELMRRLEAASDADLLAVNEAAP